MNKLVYLGRQKELFLQPHEAGGVRQQLPRYTEVYQLDIRVTPERGLGQRGVHCTLDSTRRAWEALPMKPISYRSYLRVGVVSPFTPIARCPEEEVGVAPEKVVSVLRDWSLLALAASTWCHPCLLGG